MKLLFNAKFYTMKSENNFIKAILIHNDRIIDIFSKTPDVINAEKIDMKGAFILPGFIDTHTHSFEGGLYSLSANLEQTKSLKDVFEILRETKSISGKIFAFNFDETLIKEQRFPTISELDFLFPNKPVIIRRIDGHSCAINSFAAKKLFSEIKKPENFTGLLKKRWNDLTANWFHENLNEEGILSAYHKASDLALKSGHTTIHTMIGNGYSDPEHFEFIHGNLKLFGVDFVLYPQITDVDAALKMNSPRIGGCILADGSIGSHTAALLKPYSDKTKIKGELYQTNKFWESFISKAHKFNLQIAIHAIGDAAISQILKIFNSSQKKEFKNLRHQIIHNELTSDEMLDMMASNRISAVMQPMFDRLWANPDGLYEQRLGEKRIKITNRFRSILARKIHLTGSSDWYVTKLDAIAGIHAATQTHNRDESVTTYEAVKMYTSSAAKLSFDENKIGKIEKNMQADLVILDNDIFEIDKINNIKVKGVVKAGNLQWNNLSKN